MSENKQSAFTGFIAVALLLLAGPVRAQEQPQQSLGGPEFSGWTGLKKIKGGVAEIALPGEASFQFGSAAGDRNWSRALGLRFDVRLDDDRALRLNVHLLTGPNPGTAALIQGKGWHTVTLPWRNFDFRQSFAGFLGNCGGVSLGGQFEDGRAGRIALRSPQMVRGDHVWLQGDVRGKSAESGDTVRYDVQVGNPTPEPQGVTLTFEKSGYDAMKPAVTPDSLLLKPGEVKSITVTVEIPNRVPPGGHETQILRATGNGASSPFDKLEFVTASSLNYPNILHTQEGWDEVRANIQKYDWAKDALAGYVKRANDWNVPSVRNPKDPKPGDWLFIAQEQGNYYAAGVAYQGTGDPKYAAKVRQFLLRLSDPANGYPITRRACNQASVQEGHFFQQIATSYDMTIPSGVYSAADRDQIDTTLRLFVGPEINEGQGIGDQVSNWSVSYLCGQLYASLVLQDLAAAKRFLYAPHGIIHQLVHGTLDDGWWYELSISYNTWVASEFSQVAIAMQPWGYDLANARFPSNYRSGDETLPANEEYGMSKAQWGPIHHNWIGIKRMWDVLPKMVDYRGVMFALNDSTEMRVAGYRGEVGAQPLELAYYLYRDPAYAAIIKRSGLGRDLLYGVPDLPDSTSDPSAKSTYADNAGVAVLRSASADKPARERIQAVLRYGDHGWYHGHFDIGDLVHLSRYGRSFFNPELIWYGYPNYMYKFLVQTSVTKNMVVVDQKMQEPAPSDRLLFHDGKLFQAAAIQVNTRWSNPPYGGMRYWDQPFKTFAEKALAEGRSVPTPATVPPYENRGSITGYTEPVLQRRATIVTDDYVVLADYLKAANEHTFESLFQMKNFQGLEAPSKTLARHTGQWNPDPLSSAQFITDCDWYDVQAPARAGFQFKWGEGGDWLGTNEAGVLNMDVYTVWPPRQEIMLATAGEDPRTGRQVTYAVRGDGKTLAEGKTGTWLLGQVDVDVPLQGVKSLELETQCGATNPATLFWAGARVVTAEGKEVPLSQLPVTFENAQQPKAPGQDFAGGLIKIAGVQYADAVSAQPRDGKKPAVVRLDLTGLNAVRLKTVLGGDYPVGDESNRRRTMVVRVTGTEARFLTVVEPFEDKRAVKSAVATGPDKLRVELNDGRVQELQITGLDGDGKSIAATVTEVKDGQIVRTETTAGLR